MLRIGIIGAGRIGEVHTRSIQTQVDGARVTWVCDPFLTEAAREWAAGYGVARTTLDYREVLADPEVDAVFICSSTTTHTEISLAAIRAGKHVLCEKPVSQDIGEIEQVAAALEGTGIKYQVGFNRRFDHNFLALRRAVVNGDVGQVYYVRITSRDPHLPPLGYVADSGGMFIDMTVHDFDMARYLTGSSVEEVYAVGAALVDPAMAEAGDIDTAVVTLKMADGTIAVIDNSRQAVYGYDQRAEVFGSKGAIETRNDTASTAVLSTIAGVTADKPLPFFLERYLGSYAAEARAFVEAVSGDTDVPVGVLDGLEPILVAKAANLSIAQNRPVRLSQVPR